MLVAEWNFMSNLFLLFRAPAVRGSSFWFRPLRFSRSRSPVARSFPKMAQIDIIVQSCISEEIKMDYGDMSSSGDSISPSIGFWLHRLENGSPLGMSEQPPIRDLRSALDANERNDLQDHHSHENRKCLGGMNCLL